MDNSVISFRMLYERCVFSSLAHAVYTFKEPFFSYEQSWDNQNYSFYVGTTRGTISFDQSKGIIAGAARDDKSKRRNWYPQKQAIELFAPAPEKVLKLAREEALEYLYDTVGEATCPVATVAMWHDGKNLFLSDEAPTFKQNGGEFILLLCDPSFDLVKFWKEQYQLSDEELSMVAMFYDHVIKGAPLALPKASIKSMQLAAGWNEGLESLSELGISADMLKGY